MAVDSNEGDDDFDDNESLPPREPRQSALSRSKRKSLPSVENSLDAFIAKANEKLLDVAEFVPETREQALLKEVDALKAKLAKADARAVAAESELHATTLNKPSSSRWIGNVAAFVVGCAAVFAVSFLMAKDKAPKSEPTTAAPPSEPATKPEVAQPTEPSVTPIEQPAKAARPPEPVVVENAPEVTPAKPPEKVAGKPTKKNPIKTPTPPTPATEVARPAEKPASPKEPEEKKQQGSAGLYNPF